MCSWELDGNWQGDGAFRLGIITPHSVVIIGCLLWLLWQEWPLSTKNVLLPISVYAMASQEITLSELSNHIEFELNFEENNEKESPQSITKKHAKPLTMSMISVKNDIQHNLPVHVPMEYG